MKKSGTNGLCFPLCKAFATHKFKKCTDPITRSFSLKIKDIDNFLVSVHNEKKSPEVDFPSNFKLSPRSNVRNLSSQSFYKFWDLLIYTLNL